MTFIFKSVCITNDASHTWKNCTLMLAVFKKSIILMPVSGIIMFISFYSQIENFFVFHPQSDFDVTPDQMRLSYENDTWIVGGKQYFETLEKFMLS